VVLTGQPNPQTTCLATGSLARDQHGRLASDKTQDSTPNQLICAALIGLGKGD
jgi:hypothetical protein